MKNEKSFSSNELSSIIRNFFVLTTNTSKLRKEDRIGYHTIKHACLLTQQTSYYSHSVRREVVMPDKSFCPLSGW